MGFGLKKYLCGLAFAVFVLAPVCPGLAAGEPHEAVAGNGVAYGIIKGVVRDKSGKPISRATVAVFRQGSTKLLKQVISTRSGKFFTRIVPGTYTVLAVAQGFNPVTLKRVEVGRSEELVYGFKLERSGAGNTLPEKQADRKSAKWAIRSARRSIYQMDESDLPKIDDAVAVVGPDAAGPKDEPRVVRPGSSVAETFVANTRGRLLKGVNFATLRPVGESSELLLSGQTGLDGDAGNRFETSFTFRPKDDHEVRLRGKISELGNLQFEDSKVALSQLSFSATDKWKVREGIVLVLGVDYSVFLGAGNDSSLAPRIGVQYDLDSKTRLRSAYTTRTEERTWSKVIQLENSQVIFADPVSVEDVSIENGEAHMNRSTRFEIGVERVLDNRSTFEANLFFDTVNERGVGIDRLPLGAGNAFTDFVGRQDGSGSGLRFVLNRRMNSVFSASAGYSFGTGQELSAGKISDPNSLFENGLFQTAFGRLQADFDTGTSISTVFRFSPDATIFAIDPFEGRLAIYDPGLSVLVTQSLPSLGLPIDAEATFDARNLFDFVPSAAGEDGMLFLSSHHRMVRGSILVRF